MYVRPYTYTQTVNANDLCKLSNAILFIKEQDVYTEEHEDILVRSFYQKDKSERCCTENKNIHISEKLADSINKGCQFCISVDVGTARRTSGAYCFSCSDAHLFTTCIMGHFVDRNADRLPFARNLDFHNIPLLNIFSQIIVPVIWNETYI